MNDPIFFFNTVIEKLPLKIEIAHAVFPWPETAFHEKSCGFVRYARNPSDAFKPGNDFRQSACFSAACSAVDADNRKTFFKVDIGVKVQIYAPFLEIFVPETV